MTPPSQPPSSSNQPPFDFAHGEAIHHSPSIIHHRRRHLWPQGLTGRLLAIFALGLIIAQSLTGVLYWRDRHLNNTPALVEAFGDRVIAIASLLDTTPPEQQSTMLQALNGPLLHVETMTTPPPQKNRKSLRHRAATGEVRPLRRSGRRRLERLQSYLSEAIEDPISVSVRRSRPSRHPPPYPPPRVRSNGSVALWPSRRQLVVTIEKQLTAGPQWWVFTIPVGFGSRHHGPKFPLWLLMTGLGIWLLSAWATRRITDPLLHFAAAADRLGMNVNAPPLPERGSRELRQAAQAFNQMQARLQRLIRDRTFMLAAISHDLRTILTRLQLRTEFIDDSTQQQKAQADLAQMDAILNSTLTFAKEDSTPEARTTMDLASLLQSICDDLSDAGHAAHFDSSPFDGEHVDGGNFNDSDRSGARTNQRFSLQGQPTALRRAFTNLIENAAIYGQVARVTITAVPKGVEVAIADQGPGIPPEMREKVFQPFFRLEQSRNRETGGTGLGLAVARTVIQRHGGEITLQNSSEASMMRQSVGGLLVIVHLPVDPTRSQTA